MNTERLEYLVYGWLDGCLTGAELAELDACVRSTPTAREQFWRLAAFHALLSDHPYPVSPGYFLLSSGVAADFELDLAQPGDGQQPLTTADPEWFVQELPLTDEPPLPPRQSAFRGSNQSEQISLVETLVDRRGFGWGLAAAALLAFAFLSAFLLLWNGPEFSATLIAIAQPRWQGAEQLKLGDRLPARKPMRLEYGAVEFEFPGAATVLIRGPAEFEALGRGRLRLTSGELTAHMLPGATRFVVEAAGMYITDLGTEFAVSIDPTGKAQVTVLEGRVAVDQPASTAGPAQRIDLNAGEAVGREAGGAPLAAVPALAPERISRDIAAVRVPLNLHSTGAGLQLGDPDPAWILAGVSNEPDYVAKPGIVTRIPAGHFRGDPTQAQWLSQTDDLLDAGAGLFTFESVIDVGDGVDPRTVMVLARVAVDNGVRRVRLNGADVGWQTPAALDRTQGRNHELVLSDGFIPGRNRLEIDVENIEPGGMGLRVALEGSGCLLSQRRGNP